MADSSPDPSTPRRPASSSGDTRETRSPLSSRASVPPSEPRPSRASFSQLDINADRPARLQMIVALLLGLVLVAIPLYLWRRPRAESIAVNADAGAAEGASTTGASVQPGAVVDDKPILGEPRSVMCQDPGPRKTAPENCDRLLEVEKALGKAIEESAACMPKDLGGGTVSYVADVSFKRKVIHVATPKEGRTLKNAKAVAACQAAVKSRVQALPLESMAHAHARYRIAITATYPGFPR